MPTLHRQSLRASAGKFFTLFAVVLSLACAVDARAWTAPATPQTLVDTTPVAPTGVTITVPQGGDLQGALNNAQAGDVIMLAAGATFTGTFTLPGKIGNGWITIRTSAPDSSLPPYGSRITPAWASVLPKIVSNSTAPALITAAGAHGFRFVGVEITVASNVTLNYGLVVLGEGSSAQTSLAQVPYGLIFDRVYVHGTPTGGLQRAFAFNSASTAVVNSYVSDVHYVAVDSQAICGWNGPGPFKIVNNYLEAAGENVLFGGADPQIPNLVPADIEIRGNYFNKPTAWRGGSWSVKNLLELKNAQRVLADGNVFEHTWLHAQTGVAILFTTRNQDGAAPWSIVTDVTFTHNIVRHAGGGVNVLGLDDIHTTQQPANRLLIQHNLFDDISGATWGGNGRLFTAANGAVNVTFDHNTGFEDGAFLYLTQLPEVAFTYSNNLMPNAQYGLLCDAALGLTCITSLLPGSLITANAVVGGSALLYPIGNFFPAALSSVGFVDLAGGNYQLSGSSPYKGAGTDGKDVGVDWNALMAATATAVSGNTSGAPPSDTTPPTVSLTAPAPGATVSGTVTVTATASDAGGIAQVVFKLDGGASSATRTSAPYQTTWDTTATANGSHTLVATATDLAGNQATSTTVTVTVSNASPSPSPSPSPFPSPPPGGGGGGGGSPTPTPAPLPGSQLPPPDIKDIGALAVSSRSAIVSWVTDVPGDSQVEYGATVAYGSLTVPDPTLATVHAQVLSSLDAAMLYHYRVWSRGSNGGRAASADRVFTTLTAPPPQVPDSSILQPVR